MVADSRSVSASSYDKNCNKNESMISSLLNRLNNGLCLCSQPVDDVEYEFDLNLDQIDATERKLEEIMKELLIDIDLQEGGARPSSSIGNASLILDDKITALNSLYQLSSVKSNRYVYAPYYDESYTFTIRGTHKSLLPLPMRSTSY